MADAAAPQLTLNALSTNLCSPQERKHPADAKCCLYGPYDVHKAGEVDMGVVDRRQNLLDKKVG